MILGFIYYSSIFYNSYQSIANTLSIFEVLVNLKETGQICSKDHLWHYCKKYPLVCLKLFTLNKKEQTLNEVKYATQFYNNQQNKLNIKTIKYYKEA